MADPKGIVEAANAVADSLDAAVFVYSGAIDGEGFGRLVETIQPSDEQPARRNSIMFLTTFGGNAGPAYRIARLLQTITRKFYLCVPSHCKSAGTLIALGAAEIFMPSVSELGPLDVQLWRRDEIGQRRSGMVVRTALDGLAEETFKVFERAMLRITLSSDHTIGFDVASRVASEIATGVMAPVYAQVDPESLGNDLRDLSVAKAYGELLAEHGGNATKETVRQLVEDYPTHEFIIDSEEAKKLFKNVKESTEEMDRLILALGEVAYSVQDPHVVLRADRHPEPEGEGNDDSAGHEGSAAASVDQRRKATRRGNRKREPKAKEPTRTRKTNGDEQEKSDLNA
ncbi:MAG: hypothetical protein OXQ29_17135 [Rhodospirillaceae bacterium]|nr:hypothetical protein [Rhodospirillaceae bacterium]